MVRTTIFNWRHMWLLAGLAVASTAASAATFTVNCPTTTLQSAIDSAQPGDTINVSGTCTENVVIRNEKSRIVIDGQSVGTLTAASSGSSALLVRGKGITIQNLIVTGGTIGIEVARSASAVINNCDVSNATYANINVSDSSFASILNTKVHDSRIGIGINLNSTARIGFNVATDSSFAPNTIQNHSLYGIAVARGSSAIVVASTLTSNTYGIVAARKSYVDAAGNTFNSNGSGVWAYENSSIHLGAVYNLTDFPGYNAILAQTNTTTTPNTYYGIVCSVGSTIAGQLGTTDPLTGSAGQYSMDSTCINGLSN